MPGPRVALSNRRMAFGDEMIEYGAERAEQKGQPITSFARQKPNEFRGGLEPQPLQTVANLSRRAHRSGVNTLRAGCEHPLAGHDVDDVWQLRAGVRHRRPISEG